MAPYLTYDDCDESYYQWCVYAESFDLSEPCNQGLPTAQPLPF